ncbi:Protein YLS [Parasponia andersonii]|uniref:Protein YLS n=1 Tax=Parasponia andersonii TaxID=3476 RepID=A0A2P5B0X6_PARAD|nr:Protein YLS [Parasponia andersonii]
MDDLEPYDSLVQPKPLARVESCADSLSRLCEFLCNTIASLLCIIFIFGFLMWLTGAQVEVYVNDASLTNFALTATTNDTFLISYDMSLNFTMTNPNAFADVYFDVIEASALVHGVYPLAKVSLSPFYLRRKTTTNVRTVLQGSQMMSFGNHREGFLYQFGAEESGGVYNILVGLDLSIRIKYAKIRLNVPYDPPYIFCDLRVPLISMKGKLSKSYYAFEPTECAMGDGLYN